MVRPDGTEDRQGKPGGTADDLIVLRYGEQGETSHSGLYKVVPQESGETVTYAVTPDVSETENLDSSSDDEIDSMLGFRPIHLSATADLSEVAGEYRLRREWTMWALLALFILAFGETFWAWFCGRPIK